MNLTFSEIQAAHQNNMLLQKQGLLRIADGYVEVTNSIWLDVADAGVKYESENFHYESKTKFIFWKDKLAVLTYVQDKDLLKFLAQIKAKPSLFQKIFDLVVD